METLKAHRLSLGLSIAQLARLAQVDDKTVKRAESGQPVQEHKAAAIVNALNQAKGLTLKLEDIQGLVIY